MYFYDFDLGFRLHQNKYKGFTHFRFLMMDLCRHETTAEYLSNTHNWNQRNYQKIKKWIKQVC